MIMLESQVPPELEALLRRTYAAFNARDVEAVIAVLHPDVDWPNAWEGGRLHGHAAVRSYWARQFEAIDGRVEPQGFTLAPDGRVVTDVHQVVRDRTGAIIADRSVQHVYRLRDGLIDHMEVRET
jgi:ketosteroid isomerase-like protein